jgi:membrane associated rhomboid family serine protease
MLFFPFQVDLRLLRFPALTLLIMLLCTLIYYDQWRSDRRWSESIGFACEYQDDSLRWLLQKREQSCEALAATLAQAPDPQARLDALVAEVAAERYASDLGGRDDIAALLNGFWGKLKALGGSPPLTERMLYYPDRWSPWRCLTAALAHGSWGHLLGNMLFFYLFGSMVEAILGPLAYLGLLAVLALGTGLSYSLVTLGHHAPPTLGLSGVIYGVMSLFAWFLPEARIRTFYWFLVRVGVTLIPAWFVVAWYVGGDLFTQLNGGSKGVNLVAHLSGALLGFIAGVLFFRARRSRLREETAHLMVPDR